jgi:hypothetical protein
VAKTATRKASIDRITLPDLDDDDGRSSAPATAARPSGTPESTLTAAI